jgi:hypothetical protein
VAHSTSTADLLVRVVVAFALTYVLGYERELRGSPAGDRTFSLIGTASAVLGNLAGVGSPNAIAGAVTGIGFIGGGIVVRRAVRTGEIISGITTAASIFATAAIGAAAGAGLLATVRAARPYPSATIAPGDGTTGAIAFLFAVARGGLEYAYPGDEEGDRLERKQILGQAPGPGAGE